MREQEGEVENKKRNKKKKEDRGRRI